MKKQILIVFVFLLTLISCKKDNLKTQTPQISSTIEVKDPPAKNQPKEKFQKSDIRHFFSANGGSILYLNNGDIKGQARFDTDGDFLEELLKTETYGTYEEFDNYLIQKKTGLRDEFFDGSGAIFQDWKILKGIPVESAMTVISYSSPKASTKENTETLSDTKLVIFPTETKVFADENSKEADNYFTAMDDHNWYSAELSETFQKLGIKTLYPKVDNLKININNSEALIINMKGKMNNINASAILYKKGKRPIIIHLIPGDNDFDAIKKYLN